LCLGRRRSAYRFRGASRYNPAMSVARWRWFGMLALTLLLVPLLLLTLVPGAPGTVRVAGVSLAWWYAGIVAPALATVLATAVLVRSPE